MRLLRLAFANLGPFRGEHAIAFEALASNLFLIDGPTGAGKSTIIDAIVFALYDKVAGDQSDGGRLRSLAAGPGEQTYVELDFEVHDRAYRVRRSPSYLRKTLRGDKVTTNKPSVALYESVDGAWAFREDKAQAVGAAIKDIIGLDREQFVQTVVLPQGEFARFLNATSAERKPILQRIFTTSGFDVISSKFEALATEAKSARAAATARRDTAEARLSGGLADSELDQLRADVSALLGSLEAASSVADEAAKAEHRARARHDALKELRRTERVLTSAREELHSLPEVPADASVEVCEIELQEIKDTLRDVDEFERGSRSQAERDAARAESTTAESHLRLELMTLLAQVHRISDEAAAHQVEVRARSANQQAAAVARSLVEDEPCPVCGSRQHPHPAVPEEGEIDVHAAMEAESKANALLGRVVAIVGESVSTDGASISDLGSAERAFKALERRIAELAERQSALDAADVVWRARAGELGVEGVDETTLRARHDELVEIIQRLRRLETLSTLVGKAEREHEAAAGNTDLALDAGELDAAREASQAAVSECARLKAELANARDRVRRAEELTDEFAAATTALAQVESETAATIRVAEVVAGRGENKLAQPLSVYVLQSMFDDVVAAANSRLAGMLDGRYELATVEESPDKRRANAGLDLTVIDHAVDQDPSRASRTLSGGETFCVSLALALGLADTVHAYSGGVAIDTLFIDEGFGSLDAATLDDVMGELERLGSDGRVVGVISHVEAMKAIPERIDVIGSDAGSRIEVSWE